MSRYAFLNTAQTMAQTKKKETHYKFNLVSVLNLV